MYTPEEIEGYTEETVRAKELIEKGLANWDTYRRTFLRGSVDEFLNEKVVYLANYTVVTISAYQIAKHIKIETALGDKENLGKFIKRISTAQYPVSQTAIERILFESLVQYLRKNYSRFKFNFYNDFHEPVVEIRLS